MRRQMFSALLGFLAAAMLFAGSGRAPISQPAAAQSANPRVDLVTGIRQDVANFFNAMQSFKAHRQEKISNNVTFVSGDLTGNNNTGTFTAADVGQAFTDFNTIIDDVQGGGTIAVGVWTNCIKIK